jgi:GNAT superfamily N-acetyltransferase
MNIKRLTRQDLLPLSELFKQFWGQKSSIDKMQATFTRLESNPAYILLTAKQSGRLVGFGMGIICEELYGECKPFMIIEDLIVDENKRQCGVGAALMLELEKCAIDNGCYQIMLVTESDRTEALKFYNSLGFANKPYKGFKKRIVGRQQVRSVGPSS